MRLLYVIVASLLVAGPVLAQGKLPVSDLPASKTEVEKLRQEVASLKKQVGKIEARLPQSDLPIVKKDNNDWTRPDGFKRVLTLEEFNALYPNYNRTVSGVTGADPFADSSCGPAGCGTIQTTGVTSAGVPLQYSLGNSPAGSTSMRVRAGTYGATSCANGSCAAPPRRGIFGR